MRRARVGVIIVGLVMIVGLGSVVAQEKPGPTKQTHFKAGQKAPPFEFTNLDGTPMKLADFQGRYVLIDFVWWTAGNFAIESKGEIPALRELQQRFGGKHFTIIGISMDKDPEVVRALMAEERLDFPVSVHKTGFAGELCTLYGVQRCPMNFLVDKTGRIIRVNLDSRQFVEVVGELLAKEPPDPEIASAYNLLRQGSVNAALVKARQVVRHDPYSVRSYTLLADCYYAGQDWRRAMAAYEAADKRLDEYDPPGLIAHVCNQRALLWQRAGKPDRTAAALEKGLALIEAPGYRLQFLYDLGGVYMKREHFELAASRYLEFIRVCREADEAVRKHYEAKGQDVEKRLVEVRKALIASKKEHKAQDNEKNK